MDQERRSESQRNGLEFHGRSDDFMSFHRTSEDSGTDSRGTLLPYAAGGRAAQKHDERESPGKKRIGMPNTSQCPKFPIQNVPAAEKIIAWAIPCDGPCVNGRDVEPPRGGYKDEIGDVEKKYS